MKLCQDFNNQLLTLQRQW